MVVAQPHPWRIAAFFDVDRTLVRGSSILALAGPLCRAGLLPRRALVTAALRGLQFSARGFSEEEVQRAVRGIGTAVRGLDAVALRRVADRAIPLVLAPRVYGEAVELIAWHRSRGHLVFLVSASTHELIDRLGGIVGADGVVASEAEIVDGRYTGTVALCHGYREGKVLSMREVAERDAIDLAASYAYSDSESGLPMLRAVRYAVVVNPDAVLRRIALDEGWEVIELDRLGRRLKVIAALGGGTALASLGRVRWGRRR
ncbi:MAG TPA: HAD-IB family hydrolase [Chloroflexi bacterium]|nr:HAD-IB family hydrolase [Chloroflexota bacterium]